MSYTKGQWTVVSNEVMTWPEQVKICKPFPIKPENDEREDNAHLIAAAPDLLEACKEMLFSFDEVNNKEGYEAALRRFCEGKRTIRKAIAKAEGG